MSWDEAFSDRYEEWSASVTADIPFHVELARQAEGPVIELAILLRLTRLLPRGHCARHASDVLDSGSHASIEVQESKELGKACSAGHGPASGAA